jgi:hypothetical protein
LKAKMWPKQKTLQREKEFLAGNDVVCFVRTSLFNLS